MRGWGRHHELVRFGTLYILILTIIYLASKYRHDMTTEMRQPQIWGTQLRVREFFNILNHSDYVAEISPSFPVYTTQMANTSLVRQAQNDATKTRWHMRLSQWFVFFYAPILQHSSIITSICEGKNPISLPFPPPNVLDSWCKPAADHLPFSTIHPRQAPTTWMPTAAMSGQLWRLWMMQQRGNPWRACFHFDPVLEYYFCITITVGI